MFFKTFKLFVLLFAVSAAAAWFSKNPGEVVVEWLGWRVSTSVPFAILLVGAMCWFLGWIFRILGFLRRPFVSRKKAKDELPYTL